MDADPSAPNSKNIADLPSPLKPAAVAGGDVGDGQTTKSDSHAGVEGAALPGAYYALTIMTALNLLNYCDRFVPSACKGLIQRDLGLSDVETALPMMAFLVIYMLTSPIFGFLADQGHVRRTGLIGAGVFLWSIATVAGAFATDFRSFLFARAAVGVGEAAYATIAPALLCDFFPVSHRAKILSYFYLAIPVGAALGYAVAGLIGNHYGWRMAFMVCGCPGMMLVVMVLGIREPKRGGQDQPAGAMAGASEAASAVSAPMGVDAVEAAALAEHIDESADESIGWPDALRSLLCNSHYMHALAAVTLVSFASGGIADWLPTWLTRVQHISIGTAGLMVGVITCVAGVGGSLCGYLLGEALTARGVRNAYFVIGASSQLVTSLTSATLLAVGSVASLSTVCLLVFLCQFCMWLNIGGCSAIIANSVHPRIRSRAFGLSILISHLGGDALSPSIIGKISDEHGGNLTIGFSVVPVAFGMAAIVFAMAWVNLRNHGSGSGGDSSPVHGDSSAATTGRGGTGSGAKKKVDLPIRSDDPELELQLS